MDTLRSEAIKESFSLNKIRLKNAQSQSQPCGALQNFGKCEFLETRNKTSLKLFYACDTESQSWKNLASHQADSVRSLAAS